LRNSNLVSEGFDGVFTGEFGSGDVKPDFRQCDGGVVVLQKRPTI
jgi:hypothetical protein